MGSPRDVRWWEGPAGRSLGYRPKVECFLFLVLVVYGMPMAYFKRSGWDPYWWPSAIGLLVVGLGFLKLFNWLGHKDALTTIATELKVIEEKVNLQARAQHRMAWGLRVLIIAYAGYALYSNYDTAMRAKQALANTDGALGEVLAQMFMNVVFRVGIALLLFVVVTYFLQSVKNGLSACLVGVLFIIAPRLLIELSGVVLLGIVSAIGLLVMVLSGIVRLFDKVTSDAMLTIFAQVSREPECQSQ